MAANINSFASLRVPAWHGLGTVLENKVAPMQFMVEAGLDWEVAKCDIFASSNGYLRPANNGQKMIVRQDSHAPLGVVGDRYESIQNREIFEFLKELGEFDLDMQVETAGALGAGETVWALARVDSLSLALGNDVSKSYLLLTNGHTGNRRLTAMPTTVRVVCQNTLAMAFKDRKGKTGLSGGFDLKHTTGISDRFQQATKVYRDLATAHAETLETSRRLADVAANWETVKAISEATFGKMPTDKGRALTIAENRQDRLFQIWNSPTCAGLETAGTLWAALNAVTEWCDHEATFKGQGREGQENRFVGAMLGGSANGFKEAAYSYALELAGIN